MIGENEVIDAPQPGGLGGTYSGSPLGCVAALAVIGVMEEEGLLNRSIEIGKAQKCILISASLAY